VIVREGLAGSTLVVDRDYVTHQDCLLVAHLPADEPPQNATLVCASYLHDVRTRRLRCRNVTAEDAHIEPLAEALAPSGQATTVAWDIAIVHGESTFRLGAVHAGRSIPALRWLRDAPAAEQRRTVSLREVVGEFEDYEPMRTQTLQALARHAGAGAISTAVLGAELERVQESPLVLNRALRETVLATLERLDMSMSEMAIRCGRVKRDAKGNESGETSWLARRLGMVPDSGREQPTPWIHTDVLALIARCGLGVSPREVEVR
jgi:hypothetical protein